MSSSVYLQSFLKGKEVSIPFTDIEKFLSTYGTVSKGISELEVTFPPDEIGDICSAVCDSNGDIICLSIERPVYGDCFRKFAFNAMEKFNLTFLDGGLEDIYLFKTQPNDIPKEILAEAECIPTVISSYAEIWPAS